MNEIDIAKNIKDARIKSGYTQEKLASITGISLASIRAYEAMGKNHRNPSRKSLVAIAAVCDTTIEELKKDSKITYVFTKEEYIEKILDYCETISPAPADDLTKQLLSGFMEDIKANLDFPRYTEAMKQIMNLGCIEGQTKDILKMLVCLDAEQIDALLKYADYLKNGGKPLIQKGAE